MSVPTARLSTVANRAFAVTASRVLTVVHADYNKIKCNVKNSQFVIVNKWNLLIVSCKQTAYSVPLISAWTCRLSELMFVKL